MINLGKWKRGSSVAKQLKNCTNMLFGFHIIQNIWCKILPPQDLVRESRPPIQCTVFNAHNMSSCTLETKSADCVGYTQIPAAHPQELLVAAT